MSPRFPQKIPWRWTILHVHYSYADMLGVLSYSPTTHTRMRRPSHTRRRKRMEDAASVLQTLRIFFLQPQSTKWQISRRTVSCGEEKTYVIHDSITDRWVVPETSLIVTWITYGMATISRMLKNIGLFCKRALQKRPVFCKETCIFKHPTHRSHPIPTYFRVPPKFQIAPPVELLPLSGA